MIYVCPAASPSISGLQRLLDICGDYAAEHEIAFTCNKTTGVLFCSQNYKQPAPSIVFLNGVRVQFLTKRKYLGVWINASLKHKDDIQRQVKYLCCAANKLRGTFDQCTSAVKTLYFVFRFYCMPMYACRLWSKCAMSRREILQGDTKIDTTHPHSRPATGNSHPENFQKHV